MILLSGVTEEEYALRLKELRSEADRLLHLLSNYRPNDRSPADRRWAIVITRAEELRALIIGMLAD